ncbi:MAG: M28 family peptidase [Vicinamibacterales bacterium]
MRRTVLLLSLLLAGAGGSATSAGGRQTPKPATAPAAARTFDSGRAWEHLRRQVAFGPRPAGSAALAETRRYLLDQLKGMGIAASEQAFDADTPLGPIRMVNVVATIPGLRRERIALGSHYDTKLFREFRFVGANDGASSTAALLEIGRVLKGRANPFTIELLFFDGEEAVIEWQGTDNTYGSRYYVQAAQKAGTLGSLRAFVLLDMIGDRHLNIRRESTSTPWLTDLIWAAAKRLGHGAAFSNKSFSIGGDDHYPFLAAGIPAVDVIDFDYPAWHTRDDTLDAVSARSLQITGDVMLEALPAIEKRLLTQR